jgi:hypothetical protein
MSAIRVGRCPCRPKVNQVLFCVRTGPLKRPAFRWLCVACRADAQRRRGEAA